MRRAMTPTREGSFRLFQFSGIEVFLHWSWLLVAYYSIQTRVGQYTSPAWAVWEYLALFGIVLLHEFGHSLATRQVGGTSDTIVLWPFGGVAYVNAPPRPGAQLWSIVAGPLVNVVLLPVTTVLKVFAERAAEAGGSDSLAELAGMVWLINLVLLIFNLLPIYPLDGGQILRSLLWFVVGPIRSLLWATSIGFIGVIVLGVFAFIRRDWWLGVLCIFIFMNCRTGWSAARAWAKAEREHRRV
jgi:Zn-dependent protease